MKQFPIQIGFRGTPGPCPSSIPWEAIAPYEGQAKENHGGQSLERLAERGGLSPAEAFMVMHGRRWGLNMDIEALQRESCAFLDKLVRESQIVRLVSERDDALLQIEDLKNGKATFCVAHGRILCACEKCVEDMNRLIDEMKPLVEAALKYVNMGGRVDGQNRDLFEAGIAYRKQQTEKREEPVKYCLCPPTSATIKEHREGCPLRG